MSGKYLNQSNSGSAKRTAAKKKRSAPKKKRSLWGLVLFLAILLLGLLVLVAYLERQTDPNPADTQPSEEIFQTESAPTQETIPVETQEIGETMAAQPDETDVPVVIEGLDIGNGVYVTDYLPYTGAFMEDRTDEVVSGVLAIQVTNAGENYIQTMDITLFAGENQAQFSLSTLFPGETVVVLEKNRMAYSTAPEFDRAETSNVALFDAHPGMCSDKLEIQCLNGVINVTNISDEDITGDILIYYKNYVVGKYYGGITYRIRIEGGLKAGEIHQGTAAHFNPDNSRVVFVTCS